MKYKSLKGGIKINTRLVPSRYLIIDYWLRNWTLVKLGVRKGMEREERKWDKYRDSVTW